MSLAWVYSHHGEALEAELASEYGYHLEEEDDDVCLPLRKLWVYYDKLPAMNRVAREILEIEKGIDMWESEETLLADLIDAVNYNTYAIIQSNSKQKVKQPKPYPRPDYLKRYREKNDKTPKRNRLPGTFKYVPKSTIPKGE